MINGLTSLAHPVPENGARLITFDPSTGYITIVNVAPERAEAPLDLLTRTTAETMGCVLGFVSGNFHIDLDSTEVVDCPQRQSGERSRPPIPEVFRCAYAGPLSLRMVSRRFFTSCATPCRRP